MAIVRAPMSDEPVIPIENFRMSMPVLPSGEHSARCRRLPGNLAIMAVLGSIVLQMVADWTDIVESPVHAAAAQEFAKSSTSAADEAVAIRLAQHYAGFFGSTENALNLIYGLHDSRSITLATTRIKADGTPNFVRIQPPTRPLGFDEIRQSLDLARGYLESRGMRKPTAEQVKFALVGGRMTTNTPQGAETFGTAGVLQLHGQGMGWEQIAHALSIPPVGDGLPTDAYSTPPTAEEQYTRGRLQPDDILGIDEVMRGRMDGILYR